MTSDAPTPICFDLPDADIRLYPALFSPAESDAFFPNLAENIRWQHEQITIFGKTRDVPRQVAWYGDAGKSYRYSGVQHDPEPWTPDLLAIKERIEPFAGVAFNSVLVNHYRDERDSVGWHSDDEPELGTNPVIGSVSFGASRVFQFRHKRDKTLKHAIELTHGSYLLMAGATQHHWLHQIPKSARPHGPRINLTFRLIH